MRTLSLTLVAVLVALAGCEKTIHEAKDDRPTLAPRTTIVEQPRPAVPAVDGVPIA